MHIEVLIINEETFSYSRVTVSIRIHIEPTIKQIKSISKHSQTFMPLQLSSLLVHLLDFIWEDLALILGDDLLSIGEDC